MKKLIPVFRLKMNIAKLLIVFLVAMAGMAKGQSLQPDLYQQLKYRFIGPDGNRAIAAIGVPGDPSTYLVGAASGGIWKTTDYGAHFHPVFDDQNVSSVSALAVSRSAPNQMWAGTGETFIIRPETSIGNGVYKSTDYGEHWQKMGLDKTGRIARIQVDPRDPDIVYACALGRSFGPQKERGMYRTTDGGESWKLVLHVDDKTGCSDVDVDPNNPNTVFAAFWQLRIDTWKLDSGGPGSGVYRSTDKGEHWEKLSGVGKGLPGSEEHPLGKVAVRVAPSNSDRVYVLANEPNSPGFYKSDDGGDSWQLVARNTVMAERSPYYTRFAVDPKNENRIYFASVHFSMSVNEGKDLVENPPRGGGDNHDVWIDPTNPDRFMVANDGGLSVTMNHGKTFDRHSLPIAQMYHVYVDNKIPYNVYGNRQDGYSYKGPSQSRMGYIPLGLWKGVGGCESGFGIPDTVDGHTVWSGCYDGGLEVYDDRTGSAHNVRVWPEAGYGWAPKDVKYRWHWTFPINISPHNHNKVYVGSQYVHVTTDRGHSWKVISPDLTRDVKSHEESSGGVSTDNLMTFDGAVLYAIAESPAQQGVIWAGSNDGLVHVTRDGGKNWVDVTPNIPDMPKWATISNIEPSRFEAGTAYISVDNHQQDDYEPYIYKTENFGKSWKKISDGIPRSVQSYVHVVREDPEKKGMLYAGTENQVYFSPDDGNHWFSLRNNMPPAPIYWLTVQKHFNDLVLGTYGRGFWIMDDINPLRNLNKDVMGQDLHLFDFRPTYRFFSTTGIHASGRSHIMGSNPPYGADINYYLKEDADQSAKIEILNSDGKVIRTKQGPAKRGINRVWWHLAYDPPTVPKLRNAPPEKPWIHNRENGWRPLITWDLDLWGKRIGPRVAPGMYTVRVTVGDHQVTKKLQVLKDPLSKGSVEDIRKQVALSLEIKDKITKVAQTINEIEWVRKEFSDLVERLHETRSDEDVDQIVSRAHELNQKVIDIESNLFDIHLSGGREDAFRHPMKLYGRLNALGSDVTTNGVDFAPTQQQHEVYEELKERFEETQKSYNEFVRQQLIPFYRDLRGSNSELHHIEQN